MAPLRQRQGPRGSCCLGGRHRCQQMKSVRGGLTSSYRRFAALRGSWSGQCQVKLLIRPMKLLRPVTIRWPFFSLERALFLFLRVASAGGPQLSEVWGESPQQDSFLFLLTRYVCLFGVIETCPLHLRLHPLWLGPAILVQAYNKH